MYKRFILDIGNSKVKGFVSQNGGLQALSHNGTEPQDALLQALADKEIRSGIVCAVGKVDDDLKKALQNAAFPLLWLDCKTPLPLTNGYGAPETLGMDRLAGAAGALAKWPGRNVLVIDAGTCITYDLLTADGTFRGGNIAPGLQMRLQTMHKGTARLPLPKDSGQWPPLTGRNTAEALLGGALWGIKAEAESYIRWLENDWENLQVVLTGGDGPKFEQKINRKGILYDGNLVAQGLDSILKYNED